MCTCTWSVLAIDLDQSHNGFNLAVAFTQILDDFKIEKKVSTEPWGCVTHCLGVCPDPGFRFGVGVPESGVGWDRASASGSLRRLDFRVRYLAIGRGRVAGRDGEAVDSDGGDAHERESQHGGYSAVMFITKLICF